MPDVALLDRQAMMELAYRRLRDPLWRARLTAQDADGTRPIVFALPDDSIDEIVNQADGMGGNVNVVLAVLNGIAVFTMEVSRSDEGIDGNLLTSDCTAGLFFQRLVSDGGNAMYCFAGVERPESGRAELVALAG